MPPDYPEDIVSLIVDAVADARREDTIIQALRVFNGKLDNDDHNHNSGLLSCALVSRDFLRRTRFQLYSNPEIRAQDRLAQFARTTGQSPELASLVQSLRIILPEDITDDEVPALSHAAKQMVNFRKLVIYPHTVMPGQIFRPASLVRTLSAFSACASMQTILLRWWQFSSCTALVEALQLFCQHRGLRHLSLSSSGIDDPDTPLSLQGDSPGPLGLQEVTVCGRWKPFFSELRVHEY
ncbi:hypothetical protein C8Q74DRAFT_18279 [Fomes fomentarius]|nr:hypothetical protein C8Q74DRAFT_18279 [Fomes fomentarius]